MPQEQQAKNLTHCELGELYSQDIFQMGQLLAQESSPDNSPNIYMRRQPTNDGTMRHLLK
jgi:hypothetical protein